MLETLVFLIVSSSSVYLSYQRDGHVVCVCGSERWSRTSTVLYYTQHRPYLPHVEGQVPYCTILNIDPTYHTLAHRHRRMKKKESYKGGQYLIKLVPVNHQLEYGFIVHS